MVRPRYRLGMSDCRPTDEEKHDIIAELIAAGAETRTLTPTGVQVGHQLAMSSEDDAAALLDALLDATAQT